MNIRSSRLGPQPSVCLQARSLHWPVRHNLLTEAAASMATCIFLLTHKCPALFRDLRVPRISRVSTSSTCAGNALSKQCEKTAKVPIGRTILSHRERLFGNNGNKIPRNIGLENLFRSVDPAPCSLQT